MEKKIKLIEVLAKAKQEGKALLSYNIQNVYQLKSLLIASNRIGLPVIAQFSAKYVRHLEGLIGLRNIVQKYTDKNIYFHLDHCDDIELITFCIESGFDSVMYDGSRYDINYNISQTNHVIDIASKYGCIVEAEIGEIGGVEDGFGDEKSSYFSQSDVIKFLDQTSIDLLALGIGNAHGIYTSTNSVKIELLKDVEPLLSKYQGLVLHGGSGLDENQIFESIKNGVVKINISTQLKIKYLNLMREYTPRENLFDDINFFEFISESLVDYFIEEISKFSK